MRLKCFIIIRIDKFEEVMKKINKELETFMKKDPPVLTMDEMKSNVAIIDKLGKGQNHSKMLTNLN